MTEFTGERVIPGQVEDDLWAEHIARYAFAARFAAGKRVLDVGCGCGYGTAELARVAREATGVDNSAEAIAFAREQYPGPRFEAHSAAALPFENGAFELVTAFELIEHLPDWRALLEETRRVLAKEGLFIISTPNKLYYREARGKSGPNPFHAHEFEYTEFGAALHEFFPHVNVFMQDRLEAFAFYNAAGCGEARIARAAGSPNEANFFVALCSSAALPETASFIYIPTAANLLRERERHIDLLQTELAQVRRWLDETAVSRDALLAEHSRLQDHLDEQNRWAAQLEANWKAAQDRVVELQDHFAREQQRANEVIAGLNEENRRKTEWAVDTERRLTAELEQRTAQLQEALRQLESSEATLVERTQWAQRLDTQLQELHVRMGLIKQSRWLRAGRIVGLGPRLEE